MRKIGILVCFLLLGLLAVHCVFCCFLLSRISTIHFRLFSQITEVTVYLHRLVCSVFLCRICRNALKTKPSINVFCWERRQRTIFLTIDLAFTGICLVRWAGRKYDIPAANRIEQFIDERYDDDFMQNRFIEWHPIEWKR